VIRTPRRVSVSLRAHLTTEMRNHGGARLFPGAGSSRQPEPRDDVLVGLLTATVQRGAMLKLDRFKLGSLLPLRAFGDEHEDPASWRGIALAKAEQLAGTVAARKPPSSATPARRRVRASESERAP